MAGQAHRVAVMPHGLIPARGAARRLAVLTLAQSAGNGVFLTSSVVFFVQVVGLRPAEVGVGLSLAGLAGFAGAVPIGKLADRYGPLRLLVLVHVALALLFCAYPFVRGLGPFIAVASLITVAEVAGSPLRSTLVHALFGAEAAVRTRAQLRGIFNVGFMAGAAAAGLALTRPGFPAFCVVCGVTAFAQGACVVILARLKDPPRAPARGRPGAGSALRDRRFLLVTLGNGLLELHLTVLTVGLPLWIIQRTTVPAGLTSVLIVCNTVLVLLLQVRLSQGADTLPGSLRSLRRAGVLLAGACVLYAASRNGNGVLSVAALLAGTAVLSIGEILQAAGGWGLSFGLPPPGRQGEYQGVFALGRAVPQFAGPVLVTWLVVGVGAPGWLVLGMLFAGLGAGLTLVVGPRAGGVSGAVAVAEEKSDLPDSYSQ
jgi:hypothetical protein